ncbi:4-(cytidine 5'-diphospho)-2-C-methyl-D-erythritol kinase [bacterium]|nr:4-(cytidine 5'-diphospho)-2-C-methyl-D-erythritol kinase [bacterium]
MKNIKVKCPAKINLTLEIVNKRPDGFHNIKSVMQMISLYDFLDIKVQKSEETRILLSGNSNEIPYNEKNLVYKAAELFLKEAGVEGYEISIDIEKHIPVSAGLAGGSTDAAGTLYGLNEMFDLPFSKEKLHQLCSTLGSDLNVCLEGGCLLATARGEKIEPLKPIEMNLTLIKPKNLGISAGEAYTKYSKKLFKPQNNKTEKLIDAMNSGKNITNMLYNDLEYAVFDDYDELQYIKSKLPNSIMSGSGSTYFVLGENEIPEFPDNFQVIKNLKFINNGVETIP